MSTVAQILRKAESLGVRLRADGDAVKMQGPKEARDVIRGDVVAHKPEIVAHLRAAGKDVEPTAAHCKGALRDSDGGFYLPWGPYLSIEDVRRTRSEIVGIIETLAHFEGWQRNTLAVVLERAMCGPLGDLLPNLAYFRERIQAAQAEAAALRTLEPR